MSRAIPSAGGDRASPAADTTNDAAGRARLQRALRLTWSTAALSALAFALLAWGVSAGMGDAIDRRLLLSLRDADGEPAGPEWFVETIADLTALGGYPIIVLTVLFTVLALATVRQFAAIGFLLAAIASGSALSTGLKLLFARGRPDLVEPLDRTFTSSFPSAHAMVSMLAWLTLAAVLVRFTAHDRLRTVILATAVAVSVLVGASRVYLGVHWPSDVLAGWFAGLCWASVCWLIAHYLTRRPRRLEGLGRSAGSPRGRS